MDRIYDGRAGQEPNENPNVVPQQETQPDVVQIVPPVAPIQDTPPAIVCSDPDNMNASCECTIVPETHKVLDRCVCNDPNKEIKNGNCEWTAEYVAKLESELDNIYSNLGSTMGGFEKSVWRDTEGNFNTSRLLSDSVAGVVLGTVGGIVTANLVKKAQTKQGFEDIGCFIGGQSVAGFGDEFIIGQ